MSNMTNREIQSNKAVCAGTVSTPVVAMDKPYSEEELISLANNNGYITGIIAVPLSNIIDCDFESFLDVLAMKLVNNECLMDISYKAVGISDVESGDTNILIEVSGDVSEIISFNAD